MRNRILLLLLLSSAALARPVFADPVVVTSGTFLLDIEGDVFSLHGDSFTLTTTTFGIYAPKDFTGPCGSPFEFCPQAEGAPADWSFHTPGGEQLLGRGNFTAGEASGTGVDFIGSMRFDFAPTPLSSGGSNDFDFVAPFLFQASIRGVHGGQELFTRQLTGRGFLSANYEGTLTPGVFSIADESVTFEFAASPTPEPATLLLLGSGLAGVAWRRRSTPTSRE